MLKDTIYILVFLVIMIGLFAIWIWAIDRCEQKGGVLISGECLKVETIRVFGEDE